MRGYYLDTSALAKLYRTEIGTELIDEGLRAPDALQLSVALGLMRAGSVSIFVAADQKLCRVSSLEGFQIVNPEQPRLP